MLLQKYEPKSTRQMMGNATQIKEISNWLREWKKGSSLILCGPSGSGKSLAIKLLAKELHYELVENTFDENDLKNLLNASAESSVFLKKKLILLEDADTIRAKPLVSKLVENSMHPVVMVAESPYGIGMPALVKMSKIVRFGGIDDKTMERFLIYVCGKENIRYDNRLIRLMVKSARGDVRAALLDLQLVSYGIFVTRDHSYNIFEILKPIFAGDRENARKMLNAWTEFDDLFFWVCENIQKEYRNAEEIANAYDYLSKADVIRSRILRRQSWGLQKYFMDMFVYGLSARKRASIATYLPPQRFKKMDESVSEKIGRALHVSKKGAIQYLDIIKKFADDEEFCRALGFDENDVEVLRSFNNYSKTG